MKTTSNISAPLKTTLLLAAVIALQVATATSVSALGILYVVNSTSDSGHDPAAGDGFCETAFGNGVCTLRAAIEETNGHLGTDGIRFSIPTSDPGYSAQTGVYTIQPSSVLPDLSDSVNITGPGAKVITVWRSYATATQFRIFKVTTTGAVNISGLTISGGKVPSDVGGGIQNASSGTVTVSNCTFHNNSAGVSGGALANSSTGTLIINTSTLNDNGAPQGGAISNPTGTLNITGSTIRTNLGASQGGGVYNGSGALNVTNTTVADNRVTGVTEAGQRSSVFGGGIYSQGTLTLTRCTVSGNSAKGNTSESFGSYPGSAYGGGIYSNGVALNIVNCTVTGNTAEAGDSLYHIAETGAGGGIVYAGNGTFNLSNSTISANAAKSGYSPAGKVLSYGGGVLRSSGTANIKSTIVANNSASLGPDAYGTFVSQAFNLIGNPAGSTGFTAATDRKGTNASPLDPKLGTLQNNGGRTQTVALLTGSPAIDKGTSVGLTGNLTTDQRGAAFPRTIDNPAIANATGGDGTDIGAFELTLP